MTHPIEQAILICSAQVSELRGAFVFCARCRKLVGLTKPCSFNAKLPSGAHHPIWNPAFTWEG